MDSFRWPTYMMDMAAYATESFRWPVNRRKCYVKSPLYLMTVVYPFLITNKQLWFKCDTSQCLLPVTELPFKVLDTIFAMAFFRWGQLVNKYSMCTVVPILSSTFDMSISITLVATRLHLDLFASHSWHSSLHFKSWLTSHSTNLERFTYFLLCAVQMWWTPCQSYPIDEEQQNMGAYWCCHWLKTPCPSIMWKPQF